MTKTEKEYLLALFKLGRRTSHTPFEILEARLGFSPHELPKARYSALMGAIELRLYRLTRKLYAETCHHRTSAGKNLAIIFGPYYKISKAGQKVARVLS
jgi:hypothetical protein